MFHGFVMRGCNRLSDKGEGVKLDLTRNSGHLNEGVKSSLFTFEVLWLVKVKSEDLTSK